MKNKEIKNVMAPQLCFPEFKYSEWRKKTLGDISKLITEKAGNRKYTLISINAGIGLVSQIEKFGKEIAGDSYRNYIVIQKEDFAYNKSSTKYYPEGQISMLESIEIGAVPNSIFTCFSIDKKFIFPYFLKYLFENNIHGRWLRRVIEVGARAHGSLSVDTNALFNIPVIFPLLSEQQKIADCLSSLDELITAQSQKLESLKAHKKGLIQQLFPAEGETVPKFRFPEFRNKGEWKMQKISGLLSKIVEPVTVKSGETYYEIGIRSHGKGIFHKEAVTGKALGNKRVFHVKENTFIVNIVFAWEQAVAVTSAAENGMIASHRFPMYRAKDKKADVNFIKYFFLTNTGQNLLGIASPGGAGRNKTLGQKEFEKLELLLPQDVKEQTAIACCLSSIDEQIAIQAEKLEVLKVHKKGLMQQLFPNIND